MSGIHRAGRDIDPRPGAIGEGGDRTLDETRLPGDVHDAVPVLVAHLLVRRVLTSVGAHEGGARGSLRGLTTGETADGVTTRECDPGDLAAEPGRPAEYQNQHVVHPNTRRGRVAGEHAVP